MKEVYFDTNIYTHIYNRQRGVQQRGVTKADVEKLFAAVRADKLRIYTSTQVIEETISAILRSERDAKRLLKLIRKLAKRKRIVKYHFQLLEDDIVAYARDTKESSKFMAPPYRLSQALFDHSLEHMAILHRIAEKTQEQIQATRDALDAVYNEKIRPLAAELKRQNKQQPFEDYWAELSEPFAEQLAEKSGVLAECRHRGIAGLLAVRSVRLETMAQLSLSYANTYQRTKVDRGDSRDMHHVVLASATPTMVTHDDRFTAVLRRMPVDGFEVIDLHTLLSRIQ
jgi:predicted nucleic acid-binding protein